MKTRGLILAALLIILIPLAFAGCGGGTTNKEASSPPAPSVTITDCLGRSVDVPKTVERVACLYAFSGHVLAMLGEGEKAVAVVEGLKRDVLFTQMYPFIKDTAVPSRSGSINIEELARVAPDVAFVQAETANNPGEVKKLEAMGIPYLAVVFRNMQEQQDTIEMIGKVVGAEERAKEYTRYYRDCIKLVQERVAGIPPSSRVRVYHSVNEATRTDARDTLPADWLQVAGVINVSLDQDLRLLEDKHFASLEQIHLWDPDVILCNEMGVADYILTNQQWAALRAVQTEQVYQMPVGLSRWGHPGSLETPLAILWTAKLLYPDQFPDLDMHTETKAFYQRFFKLELSDEAVDQILSGKGMRLPKAEPAS